MPQLIDAGPLGVVEFPDDMSEEDMAKAINERVAFEAFETANPPKSAIGNALAHAGRGAAGAMGETMKSIARAADMAKDPIVPLARPPSKYDLPKLGGSYLPDDQDPETVAGVVKERAATRRQRLETESPLYDMGKRFKQGGIDAFQTDPRREGELLGTVGEAFGGTMVTLAFGAVPLIGLPLAATQYGLTAAESGAAEAEDAGRPDAAETAYMLNLGLGITTEAILGVPSKILKIIRRARKAGIPPKEFGKKALEEGNKYWRTAKHVGKETGEGVVREGSQEALEQGGSNFIASDLAGYDPNRSAMDGVLASAGIGALVGGPMQGGASAVGHWLGPYPPPPPGSSERTSRRPNPPPPPLSAPAPGVGPGVAPAAPSDSPGALETPIDMGAVARGEVGPDGVTPVASVPGAPEGAPGPAPEAPAPGEVAPGAPEVVPGPAPEGPTPDPEGVQAPAPAPEVLPEVQPAQTAAIPEEGQVPEAAPVPTVVTPAAVQSEIDPIDYLRTGTGDNVVLGRATPVFGANNESFPAVYAWVPGGEVRASHEGPTFSPSPDFAPIKNTRRYDEDEGERAKVLLGAADWRPESYASNTKSAAEGPVLVSQGSDGRVRVLGGNGRWQMIQRLTPEQYAEFGEVQDQEAAIFGLPARPSPNHVLVRLLPRTDVEGEENVARTNRIVDLLNPSPGLIESTVAMARNDAAKIPILALQEVSPDSTPTQMRNWVKGLIGSDVIDRNTRTQILSSDSQLADYVVGLRTQAAFGRDALTDFRLHPRTSATTSGLIDASGKAVLALRGKGQAELGGALGEMISRVVERQERTREKLDLSFKTVYAQSEGFETPDGIVARNMSLALANQVERLPPNKRGESKIDSEETLKNFQDFFDRLTATILQVQSTPDLFGNTMTAPEAITAFLRTKLGDQIVIREDPEGRPRPEGDPRVKRLGKLRSEMKKRKLSQGEQVELAAIETSLGQSFLGFYNEQDAQTEEALELEADRRKNEMAGLAAKPLPGKGTKIETQNDLFTGKPPEGAGGQMALFEKGRERENQRQLTLDFLRDLGYAFAQRQPSGPRAGEAGQQGASPPLRTFNFGTLRMYSRLIATEAIHYGGLKLIGRRVGSMEEAAVLAQVTRDPRAETFFWVMVKDKHVVGKIPITMRLPHFTYPFADTVTLKSLDAMMTDLGADSYYMLHNHPSGNPEVSGADESTTRQVVRDLADLNFYRRPFKFLGHIVINHDTYGYIAGPDANFAKSVHQLPNAPAVDPLLDPQASQYPFGHLLGRKVDDVGGMAGLMHEFSKDNNNKVVTIMMTDAMGSVRAMADLSLADLGDTKAVGRYMRRMARAVGGHKAYAFTSNVSAGDSRARSAASVHLTDLFSQGVFFDVGMQVPDADGKPVNLIWSARFPGLKTNSDIWMGENVHSSLKPWRRFVLREGEEAESTYKSPALKITFSDIDRKRGSDVPMELGGMEHVRPVEMPELVRMCKELTGTVPRLKKLPKAAGYFKAQGQHAQITIDPRMFVTSVDAAKVLSHELGHDWDWLPDKSMDRGNLFGRIAKLRQFLMETLPISSAKDLGEVLTAEDRQRLRRQAEQGVGTRPPKGEAENLAAWKTEVNRKYRDLVAMEVKSRGLVELAVVTQELKDLTKFWHPFNEEEVPESYVEYRHSSKELYADAIGVLLNSPGVLQERAPVFYKLLWEYFDRNGPVKESFFAIQDLLAKGPDALAAQRHATAREMFLKGDEIMALKAKEREMRRNSHKGYWMEVQQEFLDGNAPQIAKARQIEAAGGVVDPAHDPRLAHEEGAMVDNANADLVEKVHALVHELEEAGIDTVTFGEYLLLQRVMHERTGMANPGGHTPATARIQLQSIRRNHGLGGLTLLEFAARRFHEINYDLAVAAVAVGAYSRADLDQKITPNKYNYATFANLDYLEDYIPAGIKQQIGMLGQIANPFTATLLKMIALNNLIAIQKSKRTCIELLNHGFKSEIKPAERRSDGVKDVPVPHPDFGILEVMEDGKLNWYYVDPLIARSFETETRSGIASILRPFNFVFRNIYYPCWISYNALFQTRNLKRDWSRTRRNLRVSRFALGGAYGRSLMDSILTVIGQPTGRFGKAYDSALGLVGREAGPTGIAREMFANFALNRPEQLMRAGTDEDISGYVQKLMQRYKFLPEEQSPNKLFRTVHTLLAPLRFTGNLFETLPKIAAYRLVREKGVPGLPGEPPRGMQPRQAAYEVRNYAGTPNFRTKGKSINLIRPLIPFFNIFAQGARADARRAFVDPKTRSGWWWHWAKTDGKWAVLMGLAAAGLLGEAIKKFVDGISDYYKQNYGIVPLGWVAGGDFGQKPAFLAVPRDETSRLLSGLTYLGVKAAAGGDVEWKNFQSALSFGEGSLPTLNPFVDLGFKWNDYLNGSNPVDPFRGGPIIPADNFKAGGWDSLAPMIKWSFGKSGLEGYLWRHDPEHNTTLEVMADVPVVKGWVKVSDYGYREQQRGEEAKEDAVRSRHRLRLPENVRVLSTEWQVLSRIAQERRTEAQEERYGLLKEWYYQAFKPIDDVIYQLEEGGDEATAKSLREDLGSVAEGFQK